MIPTIEWKDGRVSMLDQTRLPAEVIYIDCGDYKTVARGIKEMWVRGAPAIGIAAAMGVALAAKDIKARDFDAFYKKLLPACEHLAGQRPTAVNLFWAIERMKRFALSHKDEKIPELKEMLAREAVRILDEDVAVNRAIGEHGAQFIRDGDTILTHCNAGSLATGGYGTATAPMRVALEQGKRIKVLADETRPLLQGARLTAWELMQDGIDVTLITDSMAGYFMKKGEIDLAIVGTDRTVRNGDVANKIGTYTVAVMCREHGIPFYVAAPTSTIDLKMPTGEHIPIEERAAHEVTEVFGKVCIAPEGVKVANPAFDVTPARYVTAIITEKGAFAPRDIRKLGYRGAELDKIRIKTGC
ncbi:MAG TPA: S-methyl-5-thioribose-1-phosphate isomerase [Nitrospirota bacterium]|nr:S-methyl-5-thioribose-1-phosphate isomerase [Nitrospirota bacterium]